MAKRTSRPRPAASRRKRPRTPARRPVPAPQTPPPALEHISEETPLESPLPAFMIAGIGASAGGLEACSQLFEKLPPDLNIALIVVQHLAPQHESFLPELLAGHAKMPVLQATDGLAVEPKHIYVMPPNVHMHILEGKLRLVARPEDRTQHMPVDSFFRSLAEYAQLRAIAIVLSGTGSDGAIGIREIKAAGGITLAQEPRSARSDGMPRAAIATGAVDLILDPDAIAAELLRIATHPLTQPEAPRSAEALASLDDQLPRIFVLLRNASGVDFSHYKLPTIKRRLQRRMVLHKLATVEEYLRFLQKNPAEVHALYQDILIHVTRFFRDPDSFAVLAHRAFPAIANQRPGETPIRVWVPGCATGEEVYSVAIVLQEFLGDQAPATPIQIFGTDVSEEAIDHARAGVYPESIIADVSPERLRRYFTKIETGYRINKPIRDLCIFARQDLTRDPPFSKLDLILCRNVLIYLGPALQKRLMNVFHYALKPTGFLMLGSAETVGTAADLFAILDKRHKLYARRFAAERPETGVEFPLPNYGQSRAPAALKVPPADARPASVQNEASHIILARYSPAGVVVNDDLQVVQFRGQTGRFLEPPPGEPSLSLLKMAREGLLYGLRTALHEARKLNAPVRREGLRVRVNGGMATVNIEAIPLHAALGERHFLVLFEELGKHRDLESPTLPPKAARKAKGRAGKTAEAERVRSLEQELAASREYLQSIILDLEAANEELQSANEEILSANEELQSTNEELDTAKEELQSTNEELNTVNEELQSRNEELSRVNSDLLNLLANVQIAIVMVSGDLRIRRFTPMAERVLNLIPTDIGRPISDIKPNIDCPDLETLIAEAVGSVTLKERNVRDRSGKWYALRIRPYKSVENRIDGAVIALFEIQDHAAQPPQADGERTRRLAEALANAVADPMVLLDVDFRVQAANDALGQALQAPAESLLGQSVFALREGIFDQPAVHALLTGLCAGRRPDSAPSLEIDLPGLGRRTVHLLANRADMPQGPPLLCLSLNGCRQPP